MLALNCNLTEYTSFRQLEFEYTKLKEQCKLLQAKLSTAQTLYSQTFAELQKCRKNALNQLKLSQGEAQQAKTMLQKLSDLINTSCQIIRGASNKKHKGNDVSEQKYDKNQSLTAKVSYLAETCIDSQRKHTTLLLKREKQIELSHNQIHKMEQQQHRLHEQINDLKRDVDQNRRTIIKLNNQIAVSVILIQIIKQQNDTFQEHLNKANKANTDNDNDSNPDQLQDKDFAMDLLHFEKQLLQKIFARLITTFQQKSITNCLTNIFTAYEAIIEAYRQKLQIEYDLSDLQANYKHQKAGKVSEQLLIQLRKQIEEFRAELLRQKSVLANSQQTLQHKLNTLKNVELHDHKIRNYSLQIQKQLMTNKPHFQDRFERRIIQQTTNQDQQITFDKRLSQANDDQLLEAVFRKDRENMEKILQETRINYYRTEK